MTIIVDFQNSLSSTDYIPDESLIKLWLSAIANSLTIEAELTIRIVDEAEISMLNKRYRNKDAVTNVLSFSADVPKDIELPVKLLGDIVICAKKVNQEAQQQHKTQAAHWAHMTTHGLLHLLGYDHQQQRQAEIMEALETQLLAEMGFSDPYQNKV